MTEVYATGLLTRVDDPERRRILLTTSGSSLLANPVSNQNHKVLCRAIGQGITLARGYSSEESKVYGTVTNLAGLPGTLSGYPGDT